MELKNRVFLESTHFNLSTGTKKCPKIMKIVVGMSKNIFKICSIWLKNGPIFASQPIKTP